MVPRRGFPSGSVIKNLPAMQELQETWVWFLSQEDTLEEAKAIRSLQYSYLENPMDREPWQATVTMSQKWLKYLSVHIYLAGF